mgnify:CR=1 FL=1
MRELELLQENLEYQRLLTEKKLLSTSVHIVDSFTDTIKDWAFEFGTTLFLNLVRGNSNRKSDKKEETQEEE